MSIHVAPYEPVIDERPVSELTFGLNEKTPEGRAETSTWVRTLLGDSGVQTAQGIVDQGCTGFYALGATLEMLNRLRVGLAGAGVGLPCYVPINRFCLAHNTIGGLEPGQQQNFAAYADLISRELTPEEDLKVALLNKARRLDKDTLGKTQRAVSDLLGGRDLEAIEEIANRPDNGGEPMSKRFEDDPSLMAKKRAEFGVLTAAALPWTCSEHKDLNFSCRYCVAQAIVDGPLTPVYLNGKEPSVLLADPAVEAAEIFVRVAKYTRRLARE